jgi:hypothetical protein
MMNEIGAMTHISPAEKLLAAAAVDIVHRMQSSCKIPVLLGA